MINKEIANIVASLQTIEDLIKSGVAELDKQDIDYLQHIGNRVGYITTNLSTGTNKQYIDSKTSINSKLTKNMTDKQANLYYKMLDSYNRHNK